MLMAANIPLVQTIANKVAARTPKYAIVDVGDFLSEGTFGLRQAILSFDVNRGVKFATYASRRIHGSIIDGLRSVDHASRLMRRRGLAPSVVSIDSAVPGSERGETVAGTLIDSKRSTDEVDEEDQFSGMLKGLSECEQAIMRMYYADNLRMSEIGEFLGLSESRINQMHDNIIKRLKAKCATPRCAGGQNTAGLNMKGLATTNT